MTTSAIAVTGLRKSYGDHLVLDGIDFDVPAGTVFALLGQNGSGKTTTIEILTTLLRPDAGDVRVAGYDRATQRMSVRAAIGVTNQDSAIDTLLTGRENLRLIADLLHVPRRDVAGRVDEGAACTSVMSRGGSLNGANAAKAGKRGRAPR